MAGFRFKYMLNGGVVYLTSFTVKSGASINKGDICKITSGEAEPAASGDITIFGVAANDADSGETVKLYPTNAVYGVTDANARNCGEGIDISATSDGVTTKSNADLAIVRNSTSSEETLVAVSYGSNIFYNIS
jgi:hypothetical protein